AGGRTAASAVRLGVSAVVQHRPAVVCLVGAKPRPFAELGGIDLVVAVMGSMKANAPAAAAPGGADPNYVPPPPRPLRVSDLVGDWKHGDSSMTTYVNSYTGDYAGFSSIKTSEAWSINAKGQLKADFYGVTAGNGGPRQIKEKYNATIALSPDGVIFAIKQEGRATITKYIVRGWAERPGGTLLILNGPFYDEVSPECLNPQKCVNLDNTWV